MDKRIYEEIQIYKDTLVLDIDKVVILRGFTEDTEDYYYQFQNLNGAFYESSCVGGFIPLKGFIFEENYSRLQNIFNLNLEAIAQEINREVK